jgi:hypothetical protein
MFWPFARTLSLTAWGMTQDSTLVIGSDYGSTLIAPAVSAHIKPDKWSGATTDRDSAEDYPEIGDNTYWDPITKACCISMVGLIGQIPAIVPASIR